MVLLCFVLLIFFLHHTAQFMQADNVIAKVKKELSAQIRKTCPEERSEFDSGEDDFAIEHPLDRTAPRSGYIQSIDVERLVDLADRHDIRIEINYRAGHFILNDAVIGKAGPDRNIDKTVTAHICACVVVGARRTAAQDLEFPIKALVEIAIRALSPGINDAFTAIAAIDNLAAAMSEIMSRDMPATHHGRHDSIAVKVDQITFEGLFSSAFHPIRQNLDGNALGLIRMVDAMGELAEFARTREHVDVLRRQTEMLNESIERSLADDDDRKSALERVRKAKATIEVVAESLDTTSAVASG